MGLIILTVLSFSLPAALADSPVDMQAPEEKPTLIESSYSKDEDFKDIKKSCGFDVKKGTYHCVYALFGTKDSNIVEIDYLKKNFPQHTKYGSFS
jgi:hypothetical protein